MQWFFCQRGEMLHLLIHLLYAEPLLYPVIYRCNPGENRTAAHNGIPLHPAWSSHYPILSRCRDNHPAAHQPSPLSVLSAAVGMLFVMPTERRVSCKWGRKETADCTGIGNQEKKQPLLWAVRRNRGDKILPGFRHTVLFPLVCLLSIQHRHGQSLLQTVQEQFPRLRSRTLPDSSVSSYNVCPPPAGWCDCLTDQIGLVPA